MARHVQPHRHAPAGPSQRQLRAGELVRHALVDILREEAPQDPALEGVSVTVTEVKMSPDLKHAICFVVPLGGAHAAEVTAGLNRVAKFLRGRLGRAIDLRFTPDLKFVHDDSFEAAEKMARLLADPKVRRDVEAGELVSRRRKGDAVSGWINLDKPLGITSTQAVSRVRRAFNAQKAGHAGTLDPLASGVLPIALGEATKTAPFLMDADKTYRFTVEWGRSTASFDREGQVTATSDVRPARAATEAALTAFVGEIWQTPPAFSAIKVDGERAYDLAREGVEVQLEPRPVVIHAARVLGQPDEDHVEIEIECGKGTYVRALVRDLAAQLGACAHLAALRRTRVGGFCDQNAIPLENLEALCDTPRLQEALLPVETALDDIPALAVTQEDAFRLTQGRAIVLLPRQVEALKASLKPGSRTAAAFEGGKIVALCEMRAGRLNPTRVFQLA